jgi:hypothetical protein
MPTVKKYLILGFFLAFSAGLGHAGIILCDGCVATVFSDPFSHIDVASDGESSFDPFGAGFDTSDGINFNLYTINFVFDGQPGWQQLTNGAWVLPADLSSVGCGVENEPVCEPIGHWTATPGLSFGAAAGTYYMLDANGDVSDIITLDNGVGEGARATITFQSDPLPEPGTWLMLGTGLLVVAGKLRRKASR